LDELKIVGFLISAGSSYIAFFYKLCQVHRSWREVVYQALMTTLVLQCATFTMGAVALSSEKFLGIRNFAILILFLLAVALCVSARIVLLLWSAPLPQVKARIRYWLLAAAALGVVLVVLFFAGGAPDLPQSALETGTRNPVILTFLLLFIISQAIPCIIIYRQCLPYARITDKPWLRRALRLLATSAVVLLLYCLARTVNTLSTVLGINVGNWQIAASAFSALGIVILSVSLTMPSWGVHVSNLRQWVRDYTAYRALSPLWNSLYELSPGIALEPPTSSVTDMHYRLYRRVIEIRDGLRVLRPYLTRPDDGTSAADGAAADGAAADGASANGVAAHGAAAGENRQAVIEAMMIKQAIQAWKSGHAVVDGHDVTGVGDHDATTFTAEVSWLSQVSAAYGRLALSSPNRPNRMLTG
jgi:hypothetical protein